MENHPLRAHDSNVNRSACIDSFLHFPSRIGFGALWPQPNSADILSALPFQWHHLSDPCLPARDVGLLSGRHFFPLIGFPAE